MARTELVDQWSTALTPGDASARLEQFVESQGIRCNERSEGRIVGEQGSQLWTRLLGGWFVSPKHFPTKITVVVSPVAGGTGVHAQIEEALGFGLLDPAFRSRYESHFVSWMQSLKTALPPS